MNPRNLLSTEAVLLCLWLSCVNAFGADFTLEIYGDSISAGFLDETKLVAAPTLPEIGKIISDLATAKISGNPSYITAHENRSLAWPATLSQFFGKEVVVQNHAVTGAKSVDLISELSFGSSAKEAMAFFFIGHNDLCHNTLSAEELSQNFRANFERALKLWNASHSGATAYFLPVSEIERLYQSLDGTVWHNSGSHAYTCEDSWTRLFPYCRTHYEKFKQGTLTDFLSPRIEKMRNVLRELASLWDRKNTRGNHFEYLESLEQLPYTPSYFAVDCYHLSSEGQAEFGSRVFHAIKTARFQ